MVGIWELSVIFFVHFYLFKTLQSKIFKIKKNLDSSRRWSRVREEKREVKVVKPVLICRDFCHQRNSTQTLHFPKWTGQEDDFIWTLISKLTLQESSVKKNPQMDKFGQKGHKLKAKEHRQLHSNSKVIPSSLQIGGRKLI